MSDFKNEYKQAVDGLEPDGRLLESLKAAADAPPKPNFFVKYSWAFGSAAACLAVALAVGIMLSVGSREMASGGAMMNDNAVAETVGNAVYGINGDAADDEADGAMLEPEESAGSYAVTTYRTAAAEDDMLTQDAEFSDVEKDISMPDIEPQQVEALKPLSYEELKALMLTDQGGSGLILSDFALYDYIEVVDSNVYYLVLRYDSSGFTFPVVAAIQWFTPSDYVASLRLYQDYDDPSAYIDLRKVSPENLDGYFPWLGYTYYFDGDDVAFSEDDLEQLAPMTDDQFFELMNRADRGTLAFSDFEKLDIFYVEYSSYTYTFVCTYTDAATERGYFLISHFPDKGYSTAPDYLILRRRRSLKELDLLNERDMLGRFMA